MKLFKNVVGRPSNEIKNMRQIFLISIIAIIISLVTILICFFSNFNMKTSELKAETQKDNGYNKTINAILDTANAYKRQGAQIQYDSYRKNIALRPEDATSQHINYTVCSGFTYGVYKNALGIETFDYTNDILTYAKNKKNTKKENVIYYGRGDYGKDGKDDDKAVITNSMITDFLKKRKKELKPGDLFVYKDNTGFGHVVLIESIAGDKIYILEAIGGNYNSEDSKETYDKNGAINRTTLKHRLDQATKSAKVMQIAIIRIVTGENKCLDVNNDNKKSNCKITNSAKSRLKYKDIDIEKTVEKTLDSSGNMSATPIYVTEGGRITYVIKIKNNSVKAYENLVVTESINTSLVEEGNFGTATLKDNKLSWSNIKIGPKEEKEVKYTVKVKYGTNGKIIKSTGKVADIPSSTIETLVGKKLSKSQTNSICTSFNNLKSNAYVERQYINDIYSNKLDINLGLYDSKNKKALTNLDIIEKDAKQRKAPVLYTKVKNKTVKNYIYNNFYGLKIGNGGDNIVSKDKQWVNAPSLELKDRARTITSDMLLDGDVILIGNKESYVYCSGTLLRKNKKGSILKKEGSSLDKFLENMVGKNYIILRPYK